MDKSLINTGTKLPNKYLDDQDIFAVELLIFQIIFHIFLQSIKSRLVYVEEYPLFCQIEFTVDAMAKYHFGPGVMRNDTCPIAIYAVHKSPKGQRELRIVAIQMDSVQSKLPTFSIKTSCLESLNHKA